MKKIFVLLMIAAFAFLITSCGPNSDYYNLGSGSIYYYNNEPVVINPYEQFKENTDWLLISNSRKRDPQKFFDVKVEYRLLDSNDSFKELDLTDSMVQFNEPNKELGNDVSYEFKFHFLDKEEPNEKEMINYYGIYTFKKSPANAGSKVIATSVNASYTLLDNVIEYGSDDKPMSPEKLAENYDIVYTVKLGEEDVTVSDDGTVTFTQAGTYNVNIQLTSKAASTSDAVSGASSSGGDSGAEPVVLNITYTINVNE